MPQKAKLRASPAVIAHLRAALDEHATVAIAELRRVELQQRDLLQQLEIEKTRLVVAQEVARVGSWEIDVRSGVVVWSEEFYKILEMEPALLPASYAGFMSFIPPEDYARVDEAYVRSLRLRSTQAVEHRLQMPDGRIKFVEHRWRVLFDEDGRAIRSVGTCQDITHRRNAEAELRASGMQLRRLVDRLNTVREDEAKRIARELHDDLGQQLTVLVMELSELEAKLRPMEPSTEERLAEMHRLAQGLIEEVRKISGELRLGQLDHLGLAAAIEAQLDEFRRRSGLLCLITRLDESAGLPEPVATAAFRIFQEALTNVSRHSGATRVEVALVLSEDRLLLEIRDNGRGITAAQSADVRACGLLGMRERAQALDGRVEIEGSPGQGTVVRLQLPMPCIIRAGA
jgi:PAS domain S-box-containing protein